MHASRYSPKAMTGAHESVEDLAYFAASEITMPIRCKPDFGKRVVTAVTWLAPTDRLERARSESCQSCTALDISSHLRSRASLPGSDAVSPKQKRSTRAQIHVMVLAQAVSVSTLMTESSVGGGGRTIRLKSRFGDCWFTQAL